MKELHAVVASTLLKANSLHEDMLSALEPQADVEDATPEIDGLVAEAMNVAAVLTVRLDQLNNAVYQKVKEDEHEERQEG